MDQNLDDAVSEPQPIAPDGTEDAPDEGRREDGSRLTLADRYAEASRAHAGAGAGRLATLAMCAADLAVLQQLLQENGLDEAADPKAQLVAVGEAVVASLTALGQEPHWVDARAAVHAFRKGLVETFDASVHEVLTSRLFQPQHLAGLALHAGTADDGEESEDLWAGRSPTTLLTDLRLTAGDCASVAEVMLAEGDSSGALRQMWQADLAAFEAYLVATALRTGDLTLSTVALRWELARGLDPVPAQHTGGFAASVSAWRSALTEVVSSWEAADLQASFMPLPSA